MRERSSRRSLLTGAFAAGGTVILSACASRTTQAAAPKSPEAEEGGEEVTPTEDLMREHGVLRRILLVYEDAARRIQHDEAFPADPLLQAASLIRRFIEDYHEKLEENFVFPRFERANQQVELVRVLRLQHDAGRRATALIQSLLSPSAKAGAPEKGKLAEALLGFSRMYRPHSAREDTVLFPALRELVGEKEYLELGEAFEDEEHKRFGAAGFEGVVREVAQIEEAFGIANLAAFTVRV